LKPAADRLKLDIKTATGLARQATPGATGVLANAKVLEAIFSPDAIDKKRNTAAVEAGGNQMVAARITQYSPAKTLDFADVRSVIKDRVIAQKSAELAKKEGEEKLAAWKANPAAATFPAATTIARDQPQNTPPQVLDAAMRVDTAALPQLTGVDLGAQGYAVVRVIAAIPRPAPPEAAAKQEQIQYSQGWSNAEGLAYYNLLKARYKAQIMVAKPVRAAAGSASAGG
jgi:peptidyl-prolyl cis-trans isomerase D